MCLARPPGQGPDWWPCMAVAGTGGRAHLAARLAGSQQPRACRTCAQQRRFLIAEPRCEPRAPLPAALAT